jgi:hypothetical protein
VIGEVFFGAEGNLEEDEEGIECIIALSGRQVKSSSSAIAMPIFAYPVGRILPRCLCISASLASLPHQV